jgi:hypothetical protein
VKVKAVPPTCTLLYTTDGSDPANNGIPYAPPGIEAMEGATVCLYAERAGIHRETRIPIPKGTTGPGGGGATPIDPAKPVLIGGKGFKLVTRSATYAFIHTLPVDAGLEVVQAKVTLAAEDRTLTLTWDRKTTLEPARLQAAFEFLDQEVPGGEWGLRFGQLHFPPTGTAFLQWQVDSNTKVDSGLITQ